MIKSQMAPKEEAQLHSLEASCAAEAHMAAATQEADAAVRDSQGHSQPTANLLWRPFLRV